MRYKHNLIAIVYCVRDGTNVQLIMWAGTILTGCYVLYMVTLVSTEPGTTPNIEKVFIGQCLEYLKSPPPLLKTPSVTDCNVLWQTFAKAWARKDPTTVTEGDYQPFFDAVKQPGIKQMLFWSGTYTIAHKYAHHVGNYVTLEDTFLGYLVNNLKWCGMQCTNCAGINYNSCPDESHNQAGRTFWGGASNTFARSLTENGLVQVMLNGSSSGKPAFNSNSFFSLYELPNLPKSANITVLLVHDIDRPTREHCNSPSMSLLEKRLYEFKFQYHCDEKSVVDLLCAGNPDKGKCIQNLYNRGRGFESSGIPYYMYIVVLLTVLFVK